MIFLKPLSGSISFDIIMILVCLYILWCTRSYFRLSHIPGPTPWGFSLIPLFLAHLNGNIYDTFGALADRYGPLLRIAPNTLLVSDPDVLRRMSSSRSLFTRAEWYIANRLNPGQDNILSVRDDVRHDDLRRKMAMGYAGKENVDLEGDIDDCVRELVDLIDRKYANGDNQCIVPMDLARKVQFFTSDVMSKLAFDSKFNDLRDDRDNFGYIHEIETVFPKIFCTCTVPKLIVLLTRVGILKLFAPSESSRLGLGKVLAITKAQVATRFDSDGTPNGKGHDVMASFIRHGLTQAEVEQEAVMQLAAGSDTTATGIRATILCLMTNPLAHSKLVAELDAAVASGQIPLTTAGIISDVQARKLPYLQACIKEGLRWLPPIAGMLSKKTPAEGTIINGRFIPGGVDIAYNAKAVHHSKQLFGPDENAFRPERWIHVSEGGDEPSHEKLKMIEKNNELIFGYGKYQCLGRSVALIEMNKVVAELTRRFEFSSMDSLRPWATACYGAHFQKDMWVVARKRRA